MKVKHCNRQTFALAEQDIKFILRPVFKTTLLICSRAASIRCVIAFPVRGDNGLAYPRRSIMALCCRINPTSPVWRPVRLTVV
ncbi:hypothetical protein KCP76_22970 [Salmonella enterica subsp. enterica serovar Weltevreden]|nr:hypothetical protein KCP76_22970 [Salmonella enterica subsp. enterica serovar Weltevreden]